MYLGPVSPHWEVYGDYGDRTVLDEFRARVLARLVLLPRDDPQFRRNRERIVRDAERERISLEWDLGLGRSTTADQRRRSVSDVRLLNRELSWLDFNGRVLALAEEPGVPLLERVKFCAIFSSNLDEFFQVRVAALKDQVAAGLARPAPDGLTPPRSSTRSCDAVNELRRRAGARLLDELLPSWPTGRRTLVDWADLAPHEHRELMAFFEQRIFPVLTPLAVDPAHPFPYISNLSLNLARDGQRPRHRRASLRPGEGAQRRSPGWSRCPTARGSCRSRRSSRPSCTSCSSGMVVEEHAVFRVTRNADLTLEEEEADDLLAAVEMELRRRRFGRAVRLEVQHGISREMLDLLVRELDLEPGDVSQHRARSTSPACSSCTALDRPELKDEPWPPVTAGRICRAEAEDRSIFSVIRERALLVHHPYESFASSVENFIAQAADDPKVQTIKMTLYRAGGDSPIARSLIRAAERGVQVAVLVELKARFDEATNVGWAKALERAGVHVVYGLVGSEDPRQVRARGAQRRRRPAPLLPHRHRQLQLARRPASTRTSASSRATRRSAPTSPSCSTTSPATAGPSSSSRCSWRRATCARS